MTEHRERLLLPNSTQIPNVLLDLVMPRVDAATWRTICAICRFTFGWQRREDVISLGQLARATGGSRYWTSCTVQRLEAAGLVRRRRTLRGRLPAVCYSLNLDCDPAQLVHSLDQSTGETSPLEPRKLVHSVDPPNIKIQTNSGSPKNGSPAGRAARSKSKPQPDPRHAPIRAAIADAYAQANSGAKLPWDASEAQQLDRWLRANPSVTLPAALAMVGARFGSDANHAERPRAWLSGLNRYSNGPLDRYGQPEATAAPRPTEYLRPERRKGGLA